jgi:hypothetical protein
MLHIGFFAPQMYSKYVQYADDVTGMEGCHEGMIKKWESPLLIITSAAAYGHLSVTCMLLILHIIF